jgi:hypothetical protein
MGAEKAIPSMARQTRRVSMFLATAQGMMKMTAMRRVDALGYVNTHNLIISRQLKELTR